MIVKILDHILALIRIELTTFFVAAEGAVYKREALPVLSLTALCARLRRGPAHIGVGVDVLPTFLFMNDGEAFFRGFLQGRGWIKQRVIVADGELCPELEVVRDLLSLRLGLGLIVLRVEEGENFLP